LLLVISNCLYGQSFLNPQNNIDWGNFDSNETIKRTLIERINESTGKPKDYMPGGGYQATLDDYHVIDISEDGLMDLVYSGLYGEGHAVILFENKGSKFIQSDFISGELIGLQRLEFSRTLEIMTHLLRQPF